MTFQTYRSKLLLVFFSWSSLTLDQLQVTWWKTISQKLFGFSDKFGFLSSVSLCLCLLIWFEMGKRSFIFFTCSFKMLNFPFLYFFFFTNSGILLFWSVSHKLTVWSLGSCLDLTFPGHVLYDWFSLTTTAVCHFLYSHHFPSVSAFFFFFLISRSLSVLADSMTEVKSLTLLIGLWISWFSVLSFTLFCQNS